ncbi:unnamed protein product [Cyprideis torosa]|uniref:glutamate-1-semialdehyde 2,1-aminomutase n=1 Tax=Cyprideis torosa TaxID=163714 RepID=A0A7R8WTT6_9CRUS|nr:unnamed protein product [Cyprideis torosa]CAG0906386.1 unnamed protein product [Cyprideis torosa]
MPFSPVRETAISCSRISMGFLGVPSGWIPPQERALHGANTGKVTVRRRERGEKMKKEKSMDLFAEAKKVIPGGVNSPVRACRSVESEPLFIKSAQGSQIVDVDDQRYVDFVCSWGPMIMGHAHPSIVEAVRNTASNGTSFGAPTPGEIELAEMVVQAVPSIEKVRFVNSGTEATMSAVRLARGFTGRNKIIKFDGCYHGHADSFLIKAGSGVLTLGIPGSPGVPEDIVKNTASLPYNDIETLEKTLRREASDIACVIVEPVAGNMGCIPPRKDFLQALRTLTSELGIVLIFDEVITGFRLAYGGAQSYYGILPDLTCLGKIIGGGLPVGAYGGKREIMDMVAPDGPVYQAGTLSGNPLAMAAGIASLKVLQEEGFYDRLNSRGKELAERLRAVARRVGIPVQVNSVGSLLTIFFTPDPVFDFDTAMRADTRSSLQRGIQIAGWIYLFLLAGASWPLTSWFFALSVLAGGLVALLSFGQSYRDIVGFFGLVQEAGELEPVILEALGLPVPHGPVGHTFLEQLCAPYMTYTWLVMAFLFLVAKMTLGNLEMIPGSGQNFWEIIIGGIYNFCKDNMGEELTDKLFPMIATFALYIVVANLMGLLPGFMSPTSSLNTTLALTVIVWVTHHIVGFRAHGLSYYKHFMGPIKLLAPFMFVLELVSNVARLLSLSIRLFGNIMAKETLLTILFGLVGYYFLPLPIMLLGVLVSIVQAMVFVLLTVVYISQAAEHAH